MLDAVSPPGSARLDTGDAAYRKARQHSARVRRLRILLPVIAGLIGAAFIGVSVVKTFLPEELDIESATIEDGKIVMQNPAIAGRNKDGISYSMKAVRALQDIANPDMITLQTIRAQMPMKDSMIATVEAQSGIYDRGKNTLEMDKPFSISINNGTNADFQSAFLDINSGEMKSDKPIAISMSGGSIVAQTLRMTDKGRNVTFEGNVRVNVDPAAIRKIDN
ncbi:LPS export ABC transporter periplasmic protein LptC [Rhizobium sp. SG2393]|uniref:LPS export ABC transporter periplasmic protein LptC n=1 Tax=Rhizobium sp. SG2393 TaxID=3276279 RepID=UPI0036702496